jgi:hypothetical protein
MEAVNEIDGTTIIEIINPTIYKLRELNVGLSSEINGFTSYTQDIGDLDGEDRKLFNISLNSNFFGTQTGTITLTAINGKNQKIELVQIPINLAGPVPFSLEGGAVSISSESKDVKIKVKPVSKKISTACEYTNPYSKDIKKVSIDGKTTELLVANPKLVPGPQTISLTCKYDKNIFTVDTKVDVTVAETAFSLSEYAVNLYNVENDLSITLTSTIEEKQVITISTDGNYETLIIPSEAQKIIAAGDIREIYFKIPNPEFIIALGNASKGTIIIESDNGYTKILPINYRVGETPEGEEAGSGSNPWIIIIFVVVLLIVLVVWRFIKLNQPETKGKQPSGQEIEHRPEDELYFDDDLEFK